MLNHKLDEQIRELTASEINYLKYPGVLSEKYKKIKKVKMKNTEVYVFELPSLAYNDFTIHKDSRFTSSPFHIHSNVNINYIYSGSCTYTTNSSTIKLEKNDICIFDKNVIRSKCYLGENDIVISISLSYEFLSNSLINRLTHKSILSKFILSALSDENTHENYLFLKTRNNKKIRNLFKNLISECIQKSIYSSELISSYLSIIFIEILKEYQNNSSLHDIYISDKSSGDIIEIINYIEDNYLSCSLKSLAEKFNYHPQYLSQLIKNKTGVSFKEIQIQKKMNVSMSYLENTSLPVSEILQIVEISNESYFYKKFKETYGMTPKQYRDKIKVDDNELQRLGTPS